MTEQIKYLNKKYIEDGLLDEHLNKVDNGWFDPYIYPNEGYIPICSQCSLDYDNFKASVIDDDMEVEMKHPKSCMWADYFISKIKIICPTAKIVRKKK